MDIYPTVTFPDLNNMVTSRSIVNHIVDNNIIPCTITSC